MLSVLRWLALFFPYSFREGKRFQKRSVSSPAPVTIVLPSGLIARYRTRQVWPVSVLTFSIVGYFHTLISLCEQPCVLTISLRVLLNMRLQTCEPTSMDLMVVPSSVLRKRMVRSAVPPPETSSPCWCGDQAMALTAATWSLNLMTGSVLWLFQMSSLLSLPPEQSCCSSKDHFSPQISCLWPTSLLKKGELARRSRCRMVLSREPVLRMLEFQAMAPTRLVWPCSTRTRFILFTSQICTSPLLVPSENSGPFFAQETEVAESDTPRSHSLVTFEFLAFQRYTLEASPTARQFWVDQSMRLRQQSSCRAGASSTLQGSLLIFLLFLVPTEMSSASSRLEFLYCAESLSEGALFCEYLSMLLFSKVSTKLSLLLLLPAITNLLQMSETVQLDPSALMFSFCTASASPSQNSESRLSSFLLGMYRSVIAQFSPSSVSVMLLASRHGRKEYYGSVQLWEILERSVAEQMVRSEQAEWCFFQPCYPGRQACVSMFLHFSGVWQRWF